MIAAPDLEFTQQPGCLVVSLHGRDILEKKSATLRAIAESLKASNLRNALVDARGVPGPITFMDRFQLGTLSGRYLAGTTIAVLARADQADPRKLGQLVARNRGTTVEVFIDPAAAEAWLRQRVPPA
jgi:hypothetical protein